MSVIEDVAARLQIGTHFATVYRFPTGNSGSVHFHAFGSLNQRSAEGQRFALSGVELLESFRKVAFQRGGGRVAVSIADSIRISIVPVTPSSRTVAFHLPASAPSVIFVKGSTTFEAAP